MARTALVGNTVQPLGVPNTGVSTEQGMTWNTVVDNLNAMFTELYSGNGTVAGNKTYTGTQTFQNTISFSAGASATGTPVTPAGTLTNTVGSISSSATNTTQTLASYTLPASALDASGRSLQIIAWGRTANNAAPKNVRVLFGSAGFQSGTQTGAQFAWTLEGYVQKNAANSQNIRFTGVASGGALTMAASTDTSVDTGTISISVTCADASAGAGNVVLDGFTVKYFE